MTSPSENAPASTIDPADLPKIISVDDHVIEHANVWQDRLPAKYAETSVPGSSRSAAT